MSKNDVKSKIIEAIRKIPFGTVSTYGVVANMAGVPGRARLVAKILSESEVENLPWHRVLRSSGQIAFPVDSKMYIEQRNRLRAEGVLVTSGRVKMPKRAMDLDALLWAPK
ncbi:MAG: MGMT family protein [Arenimonas sp.]|nr:MGMT family protein [Arenimonas sp.]